MKRMTGMMLALAFLLSGCRQVPSLQEIAAHDEAWADEKLHGIRQTDAANAWKDADEMIDTDGTVTMYYHSDEPSARLLVSFKDGLYEDTQIHPLIESSSEEAGDIYCRPVLYFKSCEDGQYYYPVFAVAFSARYNMLNRSFADVDNFFAKYGIPCELSEEERQTYALSRVASSKQYPEVWFPKEVMAEAQQEISRMKTEIFLEDQHFNQDYLFRLTPSVVINE